MPVPSDPADVPDVEQRAVAVALRQLLRRLESHGPPTPPPPDAAALHGQVPLLSSSALREAVAKAHHVLNNAGLRGTLLKGLDAEAQHWTYTGTLALDELAKRETRVLADLADHPPAYLVAAIGRPNPEPLDDPYAARWSWMTVASHVMSYRRQYAISDPTRALGANPTRPAGLAQETDWRLVMDEIRWSSANLGEHLIDPRVLAVFDPTGRIDASHALAALNDRSYAAVAEAGQRRIRAAPSHTLRTEVTKALRIIRARPPDRSAELERLTAAHRNLNTLYTQDRAPAAGRGQRSNEPAANPGHDQLRRRLSELDTAITIVEQQQHHRQAWDNHNAEPLAAARLAAGELATREHQALLTLEQDPPPHLASELGHPPASEPGRQAWRHGARLIEQYRTRHDIDDPTRPFGQAPQDRAQQAELTMIRHALDRVLDGLHLTGTGQLALPPPPRELALDQ
ncbi:MAG TPA: hypothetical protein VFA45_13310 [Actinomycetes bacterium]|nr:hypothetical protein [Actinomycetes bacterium]